MELNLRRKSHPMSALESTPGCAASSKQYFKHRVRPHDSIIAISLKYDVSVEQLKRENKLWSNDALVLREFLLVPVTKENSKCVPAGSEIVRAATLKSDTDSVRTASNSSSNGPCEDCDSERVSSTSAPDLSAKDFLNKYDSSIAQLKSNVQRMEESTSLQNVCWTAKHSPLHECHSSDDNTASNNNTALPSQSQTGCSQNTSAGKLLPKSISFDNNSSPVLVIRSRTKQVKSSLQKSEQTNNELFQL
ncbi:lysM and putative peptidoglycan-binding domain-containing protein 2 isoform X2 [Octopus bimaculoides]|uniref:lysM and putative peptidoglycan-binding domain-containing protein 2 isoform X2 n=1 Tax=Octopus bimaculoides TaxID=37653 RepID=UPI0022E3BCB9|nr:lysM and putative peptidoglycan-binding domain-containing protein 2 isoform X2 [Octopus bimaculoides]